MNPYSSVIRNTGQELYTPIDMYMTLVAEFSNKATFDTYSSRINVKFKGQFKALVDTYKAIVKDFDKNLTVKVNYFNANCAYIFFEDSLYTKRESGFIFLDFIQNEYRKNQSSFTEGLIEVDIRGHGSAEFIQSLEKESGNRIVEDKTTTLTWYYISDNRVMSKDVTIKREHDVHDEFYPFIQTSLKKYFDAYMKSDDPILLLLGEPGTGKTSFTRELILQKDLSPIVTYDQTIIKSDSFFLEYLTGTENDLMVIEDADELLYSREDGNNVMSKILNLSDGLVKLDKKKIIITTNIINMAKIDSALLRPGRCFDKIEFQKLTKEQAEKAAKKAGVKLIKDQKDYTIAEIFAKENSDRLIKDTKVGSTATGMGFTMKRKAA